MNYNRKTFRFAKLEKSCDFARRKNDVEDKMLDTKLKVMEKEERSVRQKLFEIRREKYSRSFYKNPDRPKKFVDVNVCETEEGEDNKLNLITASGVERTKSSLRRRASVVEELNPGQVVRVCVSSKLEDKVTGDENTSSGSFPPIGKARKQRRHSVAIVTDFAQHHDMPNLFTSVTSYLQSISECHDVNNISKDDFYFGCKNQERRQSETTLDERGGRWTSEQNITDFDTSPEELSSLSLQTKFAGETSKGCSLIEKKIDCAGEKGAGLNDSSATLSTTGPGKTETGHSASTCTASAPSSPTRKVAAHSQNSYIPSPSRPQSSRSHSDSSLQERSTFRKCSTPVPSALSKKHSRVRFVESGALRSETDKLYESVMGLKRRPRSLSATAGTGVQDTVLTEKEEKMAEQVIIRQLEIQTAADKMRKLSLQHFGDSKNTVTLKVSRRLSNSGSSPYARKRPESASSDVNNNTDGAQRPGMTRRHTDNPQVLRKLVKDQCKNEKGQTTMEHVLCELSGDMPDCRYLRCDQVK